MANSTSFRPTKSSPIDRNHHVSFGSNADVSVADNPAVALSGCRGGIYPRFGSVDLGAGIDLTLSAPPALSRDDRLSIDINSIWIEFGGSIAAITSRWSFVIWGRDLMTHYQSSPANLLSRTDVKILIFPSDRHPPNTRAILTVATTTEKVDIQTTQWLR